MKAFEVKILFSESELLTLQQFTIVQIFHILFKRFFNVIKFSTGRLYYHLYKMGGFSNG